MEQYPSIINSSKAPRKHCVAFDKKDGSNFRAKWTQKRGFDTFGTRTQLISVDTEFWGEMVTVFQGKYAETFDKLFRRSRDFRNEREITVYGEFLGENSFAGRHEPEPHDICFFDVLVGTNKESSLARSISLKPFRNWCQFPMSSMLET